MLKKFFLTSKFSIPVFGGASAMQNVPKFTAKILQAMLTGPYTGLAVQACV